MQKLCCESKLYSVYFDIKTYWSDGKSTTPHTSKELANLSFNGLIYYFYLPLLTNLPFVYFMYDVMRVVIYYKFDDLVLLFHDPLYEKISCTLHI